MSRRPPGGVRPRPLHGLWAAPVVAVVLLSGCSDEAPVNAPFEPPVPVERLPTVTSRVEWPAGGVFGGEGVAVGLRLEGLLPSEGWGAQGEVHWDPSELRWTGQIPEEGRALVLNAAGAEGGVLRFVALDPRGIGDRAGFLTFEVLQGPVAPPRVVYSIVVDAAEGILPLSYGAIHSLETLPSASDRRVFAEWQEQATVLDPGFVPSAPGPLAIPGVGLRYGDATLDGNINVLDALYTANVSVGNTAVAECILRSDAPARDCLAANVFPPNLPGLGEPDDDCPPGIEGACAGNRRIINVLDNLRISRESVGIDEEIVGEAIPLPVLPGDTVLLTSPITGTRTLTADTVYRLAGSVEVGVETGAAGELVIAPGTVISAEAGAALVITRNGRILADGRSIQPIVFRCQGASPSPGCWQGLVVRGNATLSGGSGSSPEIPGRAAAGCGEVPAGAGAFGGCADADSSGVLRHVRIEYAGGTSGGALELQGVGSGTVVRQIYPFRSGADGIVFRGGTVGAKEVRVQGPTAYGIRWSEGWRGALQFAVVQASNTTQAGIRGSNTVGDPDASPRSAPHLRNVTLIGAPDPLTAPDGSGGIVLTDGTAGTLRSFLLVGQPESTSWVLDIDGQATWDQAVSGGLAVDSLVVSGYGRLGDQDADPVGLPWISPDAEGQYLRAEDRLLRQFAGFGDAAATLRGAWASVPDLRPSPAAAATAAACPSLSGDPFFEPALYCGGVAPPLSTLGEIMWLEPAPLFGTVASPPTPTPGFLQYTVSSPQRGPLAGVALNGPTPGITGGDGIYRSYTAPGGSLLTLTNLPSGCTDPGILILLGPAGGSTSDVGVEIQCTLP